MRKTSIDIIVVVFTPLPPPLFTACVTAYVTGTALLIARSLFPADTPSDGHDLSGWETVDPLHLRKFPHIHLYWGVDLIRDRTTVSLSAQSRLTLLLTLAARTVSLSYSLSSLLSSSLQPNQPGSHSPVDCGMTGSGTAPAYWVGGVLSEVWIFFVGLGAVRGDLSETLTFYLLPS